MGRNYCRTTLTSKVDWVAWAFAFCLAGNVHAALAVLRAWVSCSPHCCSVNPCQILGAVGDHASLPTPNFMTYIKKKVLRGGTARGSGSFRLLNQNRNKQNIWNSCLQSWYFLHPETTTQFTFSGYCTVQQLCCNFELKRSVMYWEEVGFKGKVIPHDELFSYIKHGCATKLKACVLKSVLIDTAMDRTRDWNLHSSGLETSTVLAWH